ncbi:hypothetical protein ACFE04_023564 [Oxalis oulophora]
MEVQLDEKELKSAGGELLSGDRRGVRINGWEIETRRGTILNSSAVSQYEEKLKTNHLPEMVFGDNSLILKHMSSDITIHFNAFDALVAWKKESLPPVQVPAAANWKFRSKLFHQVILDYDYTFTTPYSGSLTIDKPATGKLHWEDCDEQIDVVSLASKEPILFYDEVVLYEDELADNGVSLLTVKVRVMPSSWFLLLRFWLRVDGVLMRLRDTRMHCIFKDNENPVILRECCWREASFQALSAAWHGLFMLGRNIDKNKHYLLARSSTNETPFGMKFGWVRNENMAFYFCIFGSVDCSLLGGIIGRKGYPTDLAAYSDPSIISQRLPVIMNKTQKLKFVKKHRTYGTAFLFKLDVFSPEIVSILDDFFSSLQRAGAMDVLSQLLMFPCGSPCRPKCSDKLDKNNSFIRDW